MACEGRWPRCCRPCGSDPRRLTLVRRLTKVTAANDHSCVETPGHCPAGRESIVQNRITPRSNSAVLHREPLSSRHPRCGYVAGVLAPARWGCSCSQEKRGHGSGWAPVPKGLYWGSTGGPLDEPLPCPLPYHGEHGGTGRAFSRDGCLWHAV